MKEQRLSAGLKEKSAMPTHLERGDQLALKNRQQMLLSQRLKELLDKRNRETALKQELTTLEREDLKALLGLIETRKEELLAQGAANTQLDRFKRAALERLRELE